MDGETRFELTVDKFHLKVEGFEANDVATVFDWACSLLRDAMAAPPKQETDP